MYGRRHLQGEAVSYDPPPNLHATKKGNKDPILLGKANAEPIYAKIGGVIYQSLSLDIVVFKPQSTLSRYVQS